MQMLVLTKKLIIILANFLPNIKIATWFYINSCQKIKKQRQISVVCRCFLNIIQLSIFAKYCSLYKRFRLRADG